MLIAVPTTKRLVQIQRIIPEEIGIRSVICLHGSTEEVPISQAYHAFVKRPTGIIERDFGHSAFRIDVSASIDAGKSWHLPIYLAHCFFASCGDHSTELGVAGDGALMLWASGELNHDGAVLPVEGIARKVSVSLDLIRELIDGGGRILMLVAAENLQELHDTLVKYEIADHPAIKVDAVERVSADTLQSYPDLVASSGTKDAKSIPVPPQKRRPAGKVGATGLIVRFFLLSAMLGIFSVVFTYYQTNSLIKLWHQGDLESLDNELKASSYWKKNLFNAITGMEKIVPGELSVAIQKITPEAGVSCLLGPKRDDFDQTSEVLWDGGAMADDLVFETLEFGLMQLCEVVYSVRNNSDRSIYVYFTLGTADRKGDVLSAKQLLEPNGHLDVSRSVKFYEPHASYKHVWQLVAAPYILQQLPQVQSQLLGGWYGGVFIEGEHIFRHSVDRVTDVSWAETTDHKNKLEGRTVPNSRFN